MTTTKTRHFNALQRSLSLLALVGALGLAACGSETTTDIAALIAGQRYAEALEQTEKLLAADATNPTFNALAVQAHLGQCLATDCFTDNPKLIEALRVLLPLASAEPVKLSEKTTLDVTQFLMAQAPLVGQALGQPKPLLTMLEVLANHPARPAYLAALLAHVATTLQADDAVATETLLHTMVTSPLITDPQKHVLGVIKGLALNDAALIKNHTIAMRSRQNVVEIPPEALALLVPASYRMHTQQHPADGTLRWVKNFPTFLQELQWQTLLTPTALQAMAAQVAALHANPAFMAHAQSHMPASKAASLPALADNTQAAPSPTVEVVEAEALPPATDPATSAPVASNTLDVYLDYLALSLNPAKTTTWLSFLPAAAADTLRTGDTFLLATGPKAEDIPADARKAYNVTLLDLTEELASKNIDILPLLQRLNVTIGDDKPVRVRLEKIIQSGLTVALEKKDLDTVMAYARFHRDIAQARRQAIVPVVINDIRKHFQADNFDRVKTLTSFLTQDLTVDFNLDTILLQEFETHLNNANVNEELEADTAAILLKPKAKVALNLGVKFAFLREHFNAKPDVVDGVLKNLISNATGNYGTATALYRLFHLFDDKDFPPEERADYLTATIRNSLTRDTTLGPVGTLDTGYGLHQQHKGLELAFVINQTLSRMKGLEDARAIWQFAGDPSRAKLKNAIRANRPEFTALMSGIDAFEAKDFAQAADKLARVRSPYYLKQAEPYIQHYLDTITRFRGTYVPADLATSPLPIAAIVLSTGDATTMSGADLVKVNVTLFSRIGQITLPESSPLITTSGKIFRVTLPSKLDFSALRIPLDVDDTVRLELPEDFTTLFGTITAVRVAENSTTQAADLMVEVAGQQEPLRFIRAATLPTDPLLPDGRYAIRAALTSPTADTQHILPVGSLLELTTDVETPITPTQNGEDMPAVFAVNGQLFHPAAPTSPTTVKGLYNPITHATQLVLSYPLTGGGKVQAAARCQILSSQLLCGVHNQHNSRHKYKHLVAGHRTAESTRATAQNMERILQTLRERGLTVTAPAVTAPTPVSATGVISSTGTTSATTSASPTLPAKENTLT
ncbi:MAG: hypothetical protein WAX89_07475, partial [Alphaproteobacteria bacterium]